MYFQHSINLKVQKRAKGLSEKKKKKKNLRVMRIFIFVVGRMDRNPCSTSFGTRIQSSLTPDTSEGLLGSNCTCLDKREFLYLPVRVRNRGK